MKKMLCYMLSSIFLLAILIFLRWDEEPPRHPCATIGGFRRGRIQRRGSDSNLELNLLLPSGVLAPLSITSDTNPAELATELEFFRDEDIAREFVVYHY